MLSEVPPIWFFFFLFFEVPTSTMVTHYESQQGDAVEGTPLWGIFLASVQWPFTHLLSKVAAIWFFFLILEVPTSTMVTYYETLQEGAFNGTPLWGIFLASDQWPFRHLISKVPPIWFFFLIFEVPTSTIVTHYESQQGGAVDSTPPPFGAFFWLRFNGHSGTYSLRYPQFGFFFSFLRSLRARWLRIMRPSKRVSLTAPPFGAFF
jgi:hypothetical protein